MTIDTERGSEWRKKWSASRTPTRREFEDVISTLGKARKAKALEMFDALFMHAEISEAESRYFRRQSDDAKRVAQDRDRHARSLEDQMLRRAR